MRLALIFAGHPELMIGAQRGAPLAVGFGDGEMYLGSDALALAPLTREIAYLEDGDWVVVTRESAQFFDRERRCRDAREIKLTNLTGASIGKGNFRHFMEKEMHEQPVVIGDRAAPDDRCRHAACRCCPPCPSRSPQCRA